MQFVKWSFVLLFGLCFFASAVFAEEKKEVQFKWGGEIRLRSETLIDFNSFAQTNRTTPAKDSFVLISDNVGSWGTDGAGADSFFCRIEVQIL